jgi:hypothetical protein
MEVSGQLHAPAALPPGKEPLVLNWIGGWVGPIVSLVAVEKRKILHCRESDLGKQILITRHLNTGAIWKVTSSQLLKKQAMRKNIYYVQKVSTYLIYFST